MTTYDRKIAEEAKVIPPPGSKEARDLGCECPVMDNRYGLGIPQPDGVPLYWRSDICELHALKRRQE